MGFIIKNGIKINYNKFDDSIINIMAHNKIENNLYQKYLIGKKVFKKNKNIFFQKKIILNELIIKILILINLINQINSKLISKYRRIDKSSEITIRINNNGTQQILHKDFSTPDEIYVNGKLEGNNLILLNLTETDNVIRMVWKEVKYNSCKNMFNFKNNIIEIDLSKFDASHIKDMEMMFGNCNNLKSINFTNFDTSSVINMKMMFYSCRSLESLDLSNFMTSSVETMNGMFQGCNGMTSLNISSFKTSSVTDMSSLFSGCKLLTSIDLTNFDTSSVPDMSNMFSACNILISLDLSHIDTSSVTIMNGMFSGCNSLTSLDLSSFKTSLVTNMDSMFNKCQSLESLDLSYFDTSSVLSMEKMFCQCTHLNSIDLSSFNTEKVTSMSNMFKECKSLKEIDLSGFNVSLVVQTDNMFHSCNSLESLDLSTFNKNKIQNAEKMFYLCNSLTSLNLQHFDTSNISVMSSMFSRCKSLASLDLSYFNTSSLTNSDSMFSECVSLTSINFGNFNTSRVINMKNMFTDCHSLASINLSNFDTQKVEIMTQMFKNCISLKSIDLSNFDFSKTTTLYEMFYNSSNLQFINISNLVFTGINTERMLDLTPENLAICYDKNLNSKANELIAKKKCYSVDCSDNWRENQKKIIAMNNTCIEKCGEGNIFIYEYENKCYENCPNGTHPNSNYFCEKDIIKAIEPERAEIIKSTFIFEEIKSDTKQNFVLQSNRNLDLNLENSETYYSDLNNKTSSEINEDTQISNTEKDFHSEEEDPQSENNETGETKEKTYCHGKEFFLNGCKSKIENKKVKKEFAENIINEIMNGSMNEVLESIINDNQNIIIEDNKDIYQISTLSNQKNKENYNYTSIDIGKCEERLRENYGIDNSKEIIIFKIEHFVQGYNIPIIDYVLFTEDGKIKLNLDCCKDLLIKYNIPTSINENELYKYDPENDYYNDRCYSFNTGNKTDITLYDRKNEYNYNNMSLCENNCIYEGYNYTDKKVECECKVKSNNFFFFSNLNIDQEKLLNKFVNIKSVINFHVAKCYKLLFSKEGLLSNFGSYILLFIILIFFILSILFCSEGYNSLRERIKKIIQVNFKKNNEVFTNKISNINNVKKIKVKSTFKKAKKQQITSQNSPPKKKDKKILKKFKYKNARNITFNSINASSKSNISMKSSTSPKGINSSKNNYFVKKQLVEKNPPPPFLIESSRKNIKVKKNLKYDEKDKTDFELNSLQYKDALKYDQRSYFQYYFSLLRTKHLIIFTFYTKSDYNSRIIKICLFFFAFVLYYAVNAMFFNDSTMHQIYEDQGNFNFIYQIPQIFYSTLISSAIKTILNALSLTERSIIKIKNQKTFNLAVIEMKKLLKLIRIKFILFFIFSFLFLFIFWYYLACFCAVYRNTQTYLIKDTLISFATSLLYPFLINLIPGFLRIPSLRAANKNRKCLYKICLIVQLI